MMNDQLTLTLCLQDGSILISNAVIAELNRPRHIQMLINEEKKMLLIQACSIEDREAVVIPISDKLQFEVSGRQLLKRIRRITGWTDDEPRIMIGSPLPQYGAMLFNLQEAEPVALQRGGR